MKITFKAQSFRRVPNPYVKTDSTKGDTEMYFALCDVTCIPDDFPMGTNPREQNLDTSVAKKIKATLIQEGEGDFYLLNRGILLSAASVNYDNVKSELTIVFEDEDVHGNVDGGHTYTIIKNLKKVITPGTQYVKLEILTGVEDIFTKLAAARNTSVQVPDKTIAELEKRFDMIKEVLESKAPEMFGRVIYKQNAEGDIDISDILAILNMFNLDEYPSNQWDVFPIQSYSSKKACSDRYIRIHQKYGESKQNPFVRMKPIMVDIFKLYDHLESNMGEYYSQITQGGKYGRVKGVSVSNGKKFYSKFFQTSIEYSTPTSFIYPILGAFRALLKEDDKGYGWKTDPFVMMDKIGKELVNTTVDRNRSLGNNPNAVGKDAGNWKTLYMTVMMQLLSE